MSGVTCSVTRWTSNWKGISAFFVYTCSIVGNLGGWTSLDLVDSGEYQHTLYTQFFTEIPKIIVLLRSGVRNSLQNFCNFLHQKHVFTYLLYKNNVKK